MKVIMVNDCAFVGETLLKYFPTDVETQHIKRSRSLWSKAFSLAYRILRAKGDIFHVHYLLQDCYIASRLKKRPLVGHAMGSDLRQQIKSKKWGRLVRHNLRSCDKILSAQPTLLETAKRYNESSEYFPIPFDPAIFFPKPLRGEGEGKQVFIASAHDFTIKGTDKLLRALSATHLPITVKTIRSGKDQLKARELGMELGMNIEFVDRVPHERMSYYYWESDLVLGSFGVGQLDTVAIEAMACGRPVLHSISKTDFPKCPLEELVEVEQASAIIYKLLSDKKEMKRRVRTQLHYVEAFHSAPSLVRRLIEIYSELVQSSDVYTLS